MSLETVSTKRNRVYQRKFDHDEARRLYAQGSSVYGLAQRFGVSETAVWHAVDAKTREQMDARIRERFAAICDDCGGECTHNWSTRNGRHDRVVCATCSYRRRREETLIARHNADGDIHCAHCGKHRPPSDYRFDSDGFPANRCRPCETARRREHRHRNLEAARSWDREYRRRWRAENGAS